MAKKPKQRELKPNTNPNDEAECFAVYSDHMATIARIKQKIATDLGRYEKMGVDPDSIKYSYRMSSKDDAQAIHRARTATLARLGIIEWGDTGQGDFSKALHIEKPTGEAARKLVLGRVRADGYNTGLAGGLIGSSKHAPGSEEYVIWRDGWQLGHSDRLEKNPDADKEKPADTRRSRKKPPVADGIGATAGTA